MEIKLWVVASMCASSNYSVLFFAVLGFELRAFTWSHSTSTFYFVLSFF
jgi:hypothetical protein